MCVIKLKHDELICDANCNQLHPKVPLPKHDTWRHHQITSQYFTPLNSFRNSHQVFLNSVKVWINFFFRYKEPTLLNTYQKRQPLSIKNNTWITHWKHNFLAKEKFLFPNPRILNANRLSGCHCIQYLTKRLKLLIIHLCIWNNSK